MPRAIVADIYGKNVQFVKFYCKISCFLADFGYFCFTSDYEYSPVVAVLQGYTLSFPDFVFFVECQTAFKLLNCIRPDYLLSVFSYSAFKDS